MRGWLLIIEIALQAHLACQLQAIALDLNVAIAAIDPNCVEDEWPVWRKEIVTAPSGLIDEQYWPVTDSMKTRCFAWLHSNSFKTEYLLCVCQMGCCSK